MKKVFGFVLLVIVLLIVVVLIKDPASTGTIKIGAALALSGDAAPWGEESLRSAQLAIDEINEKGGVQGKKLELVVEDMKSSASGGTTATSKLVNVDKVDAMMITWLDSYLGAESIVPKNMILISQDAAVESVNVPNNHSNVFSLWYRTADKAKVTVNEMKKSGIKTLYIVLQQDSYYKTLSEFLKKEAIANGITIVGEEFVSSDADSRAIMAKIQSKKPEAVYIAAYDDRLTVDLFKRYSEIVTARIPVYGDEFIEQNLKNKNFNASWLEGVKYYTPAPMDQKFIDKFSERFGHSPQFSAGTTYDTVYVLAKYLEDRPSEFEKYMKETEFDTITYGKIRFDSIGGVVSDKAAIAMKQIKNGVAIPY